jgi:hypothetical protein
MTARHDLDRLLTTWLTDEVGAVQQPAYFAETLDVVERTPQRRAMPWSGLAIPRRWLRVDLPAGGWAVIVVMLLVLALVAAALIGAFRLPPPMPTGPGRIIVTSGAGDLVVVNPEGGLEELPGTAAAETMASVSPDGTRIAYWTWVTETDNEGNDTTTVPLHVANLDGSEPLLLLDGVDPPIFTVAGRPEWSPDGRFLLFGSGGTLYRIGVDGEGLTRLADDGRLHRSAPTWSPDGAWIAFHASPLQSEPVSRPLGSIHVIRPDGTQETVVSGETVVWRGNFGPSWSADSRRLAFVTPRQVTHPEFGAFTVPDGIAVSVRGASGWSTVSVEGVEGIDDQVMLDWAPQGDRLAYMATGVATPDGLLPSHPMVVEPDGTLRQVSTLLLGQGFCWSPDATRLGAITLEGGLVALDVETGEVVADLGMSGLNHGDACVWSAWAGEPR